VLAHLLSRGREKKGSKTVFNFDIGCDMDGPSAGRARVRRSAAANTTFKMASSDKPLENCASKGPPSIPLERSKPLRAASLPRAQQGRIARLSPPPHADGLTGSFLFLRLATIGF